MTGGALTLAEFVNDHQWVAWANERRDGKLTKVPYGRGGKPAEADDPATWLTHDEAHALAGRKVREDGGGIGIELGATVARGGWLAGVDLDTCRDDATGKVEPWAQAVLDRLDSYAEVSPSGAGIKTIVAIDPADVPTLRALMGTDHGRQFKRTNGHASEHPPAIEFYLSHRFFAVTWQVLHDFDIRPASLDDLRWLIEEVGPAFTGKSKAKTKPKAAPKPDDAPAPDGADPTILARLNTLARNDRRVAAALRNAATLSGGSRSEGALGLGAALQRAGWTFADMKAALLACPITRDWATAADARQFRRIWDKGDGTGSEGAQSAAPASADPADDSETIELPEIAWRTEPLSAWAERVLPERQWIVPDWIPREQVTGLYGVGGIGKTDLLLQLLMAASRGLTFCGYQLSPVPAYGLFCEDAADEVARRATRIAEHYKLTLADFPDAHFASLVGVPGTEFVIFDGTTMLIGPALLRAYQDIIRHEAGLCVLDTLPDFFGGNEIVRREVTQFIRRLDGLSISQRCAIVFSAHPSVRGQESGTFDSGSTGWGAKVRCRLSLHDPGEDEDEEVAADRRKRRLPPKPTDRRILIRQKSNYAKPGEAIELVCRKGVFVTAALDPEQAQARAGRGPARDAACDAGFLELLGKVRATGNRVVDARNSANFAPAVFAARPDGKQFSKAEYTRSMQRLFVAGRLRIVPFGPPARGALQLAESAPR